MKFAKILEDSIVPEWRVKYIDYKGGKKKIKIAAKVIKYTQASPAVNSLYINTQLTRTPTEPTSRTPNRKAKATSGSRFGWVPTLFSPTPASDSTTLVPDPTPTPMGETTIPDRRSLTAAAKRLRSLNTSQANVISSTTQYGTLTSPLQGSSQVPPPPPSLLLPEPMEPLDVNSGHEVHGGGRVRHIPGGPDISFTTRKLLPFPKNKGLTSFTKMNSRPALLKRVVSATRAPGVNVGGEDVDVKEIQEQAIAEFFGWMEAELAKIDSFYRMKEDEARQRLEELREQLHIMKDLRIAEVRGSSGAVLQSFAPEPSPESIRRANALRRISQATTHPLPDIGGHVPQSFTANRNSYRNSLHQATTTEQGIFRQLSDGRRDYAAHRKPMNEITYRVARRKLKAAISEYYRGLELLKSYCRMNQEGLRKINKKFDKATRMRTSKRFMAEKINSSYFGSSDSLESIIHQTEDLFSRYFAGGDRKHAVERLRTKEKSRVFYDSTFRSGILLGLGVFAATQGLVMSLRAVSVPETAAQTSYLLQIWAGFFLPLLFLILFTINCRTWAKNKINYVFCFEFDTRHNLDYHQFLELPALLFFLMCFIFWLNFENFWSDHISPVEYPIIFLAIALAITFAPFPILYHRSRRWFLIAHWRLMLSGLYPVESRDFWLGDVFCSLTYTMGNVGLFACLYNGQWDNPERCSSSHSRLLGFFTCLPAIWRLLQCLRRYLDTRNAFPHLANAGKYACTVLYYTFLSMWRIDKTEESKALFIAFGTINAVYCAAWDLVMDWSLLNPYADWPFLRQELGFKRANIYYLAMFIDPILRFNWIFYFIFVHDIQHSALVAFLISLSEIFRRWIWAFFRMENEHCTNVGNFRAYREVPLPYELAPQAPKFTLSPGPIGEDVPPLPPLHRTTPLASHSEPARTDSPDPMTPSAPVPTPFLGRRGPFSAAAHSGPSSMYQPQSTPRIIEHPDLEYQLTPGTSTRHRRASDGHQWRNSEGGTPTMRALTAMGSALARAHAQDFERRNPRVETGRTEEDDDASEDDDDDSIQASEDDNSVPHSRPRNLTANSSRPTGAFWRYSVG